MSKKICKKCNTEKPIADFGRDSKQPDGVGSWCKQCAKEYRDSRKSVSTSKPKSKVSKSTKAPAGLMARLSLDAPKSKSKKDINITNLVDSLIPTLTKSSTKKVEIEDDDSYDATKSKQKCTVDYLISIQNHEIKGSFAIRTNYKPNKLIKSVRSVVTRQLKMLGIPDCEIIEVFKPRIIK